VAWGVEELELDFAKRETFAIGELSGWELGFGDGREADLGPGRGGELEVARQEVGVEMGFNDQLDGQTLSFRISDVFVDVAAGVDDHGTTSGFVTDQVGGL
jgi:hypothetical protein